MRWWEWMFLRKIIKIKSIQDPTSSRTVPVLAPASLHLCAILLYSPVKVRPSGVHELQLASPRRGTGVLHGFAILLVDRAAARVRFPLPVVGNPSLGGVDRDCLEPSLVKGQDPTLNAKFSNQFKPFSIHGGRPNRWDPETEIDVNLTCPHVLDAVVPRPRPEHPRGSRIVGGGLQAAEFINVEVERIGDIVEFRVADIEAPEEGSQLFCFPLI